MNYKAPLDHLVTYQSCVKWRTMSHGEGCFYESAFWNIEHQAYYIWMISLPILVCDYHASDRARNVIKSVLWGWLSIRCHVSICCVHLFRLPMIIVQKKVEIFFSWSSAGRPRPSTPLLPPRAIVISKSPEHSSY